MRICFAYGVISPTENQPLLNNKCAICSLPMRISACTLKVKNFTKGSNISKLTSTMPPPPGGPATPVSPWSPGPPLLPLGP